MKLFNIAAMNEHPMKTVISILFGSYAGLTTMIHLGPLSELNEAILFLLACGKAGIIGGCAWLGQTAAIYFRKKFLKAWNNHKSKQ